MESGVCRVSLVETLDFPNPSNMSPYLERSFSVDSVGIVLRQNVRFGGLACILKMPRRSAVWHHRMFSAFPSNASLSRMIQTTCTVVDPQLVLDVNSPIGLIGGIRTSVLVIPIGSWKKWLDNRSRALSYPTPAWVSEDHWSQATWGLVALQTQTIYEARKNPITPPAH